MFENEGETLQGSQYRAHLDRNWNEGNKLFKQLQTQISKLPSNQSTTVANAEVTNAHTALDGTTYTSLATRLDAIDTRFSDLNVGGRNLLKHTDWSSYNVSNMTKVTEDGYTCLKTSSTTSNIIFGTLEANTQYTYSAWIKLETGAEGKLAFTNFGHFFVDKNASSNANKKHEDVASKRVYRDVAVKKGVWTKIWVTFTTNNLAGSTFGVYPAFLNSTVVYIRNCKLEKGNIATDWTPAPEDVQEQIDAHNTAIMTNAIGSENLLQTATDDVKTLTYSHTSYLDMCYEVLDKLSAGNYVVSFEAKSTVAGDVVDFYTYDGSHTNIIKSSNLYVDGVEKEPMQNYIDGYHKLTLSSSYVKYASVLYVTDTPNNFKVLIRAEANSGSGTVSIRNVQLQRGSIPTAWQAPTRMIKQSSAVSVLNGAKIANGAGSVDTYRSGDHAILIWNREVTIPKLAKNTTLYFASASIPSIEGLTNTHFIDNQWFTYTANGTWGKLVVDLNGTSIRFGLYTQNCDTFTGNVNIPASFVLWFY
ncbi:hypothetical protein SAMN05216431_1034 [Ligilactobacillus sp. WC1T17]|uniref:Uncharacterized protein n=1 Tax=Ligilactobacillus ruminis TaxID=1623 RepID=A0ABY1A9Z2_9LACO|nr:hypothetical protein SAMN05216431_1034 [Ligilactobacillus ruminis]